VLACLDGGHDLLEDRQLLVYLARVTRGVDVHAAARRRIAELETELAIHRRAADILKEVVPPKGGSRRSR
jgi:hypothetical protein